MLPTQISNNATLIANMLELIHLQNYSPTRLQKETSTAALKKFFKKKKNGRSRRKNCYKILPLVDVKRSSQHKNPIAITRLILSP
jgi:hypothetical protein